MSEGTYLLDGDPQSGLARHVVAGSWCHRFRTVGRMGFLAVQHPQPAVIAEQRSLLRGIVSLREPRDRPLLAVELARGRHLLDGELVLKEVSGR